MRSFSVGIPPAEAVFHYAAAVGIESDGKLIAVAVIEPVHRMYDAETNTVIVAIIGFMMYDVKRMYISQHITAATDLHSCEHIGYTHVGERVIVALDKHANTVQITIADNIYAGDIRIRRTVVRAMLDVYTDKRILNAYIANAGLPSAVDRNRLCPAGAIDYSAGE